MRVSFHAAELVDLFDALVRRSPAGPATVAADETRGNVDLTLDLAGFILNTKPAREAQAVIDGLLPDVRDLVEACDMLDANGDQALFVLNVRAATRRIAARLNED